MKNAVTLTLVGLGAFFAYDYYTKRNKNQKAVKKAVSNGALIEAEMEEEGEEGADSIELVSPPVVLNQTNPNTADYSAANGWDSDVASHGM